MENSLPQQNVVSNPQPKKVFWYVLNAVFTLIILYSGVYVLIGNSRKVSTKPLYSNSSIIPTPMPFRELTIPYLRDKTYNSKLGNLEFAYESSNYTAYITSYDSEGLKINGLLTIPKQDFATKQDQKDTKKYPAIVFIHGYIPPSQYQTIQNYYDYVDYLARSGFVVFKIDLRGHGNSEGEPGGAYYSSEYIIDTLNAHVALQSSDFVDPKKIGLWGHSMAGNIVMRSFAVHPDIPAVVVWAGAVYSYVDFAQYGISDSSYQPPQQSSDRIRKRQRIRETHGEPSSDSLFWQQVAPTSYLEELKGAIQIHHAVNDNVVNIDYSRNLNSLLDKTSVSHELHEYSDGGHNISGSDFNLAMQRTVEFFEKNL